MGLFVAGRIQMANFLIPLFCVLLGDIMKFN